VVKPPAALSRTERVFVKTDQKLTDYLPGYFDTRIEAAFHKHKLVSEYFDKEHRKKYILFDGEKDTNVPFLSFWGKFRAHVHLLPSWQADDSQKLSIFKSLLKPGSFAESQFRQFENDTDFSETYDECIRYYYLHYGKHMAKLVENAILKMESLRPESNQFRDQLDFVISMIAASKSLAHCGISKPRAAKVAILNIQKQAYKMFLRSFWTRNMIQMEDLDTWFDNDPVKSLQKLRDDLPIIFRSLDADEGGMGEECIMKVTNLVDSNNSAESPAPQQNWTKGNGSDQGVTKFNSNPSSRFPKKADICQACSGSHDIRSCELNVWERIRAIDSKNLCRNCIEEGCLPNKCRYSCLCSTCKNDTGVIPHSTWLCVRSKGAYPKTEHNRESSHEDAHGRNKRNKNFSTGSSMDRSSKKPKEKESDDDSRLDSSLVAAAIMRVVREQIAREKAEEDEPVIAESSESKNE
jgi:hypothetical protein